jgi:hypothetical protein
MGQYDISGVGGSLASFGFRSEALSGMPFAGVIRAQGALSMSWLPYDLFAPKECYKKEE